jgi:hypothetical protein
MPSTDAGKSISRRNSLKHGLTPNSSLLPPDLEAELPNRIAPWAAKFAHLTDPETPRLIRELAVAELRVEQCQAILSAASAFHREPARVAAQADFAASKLYSRLDRQPELVTRQLRLTSAGIARLQRAWTTFERKTRLEYTMTSTDLNHALDLLGLESDDRYLDPDAVQLAVALHTATNSPDHEARQQATQTILTLIALQQESLQTLAAQFAAEDAALQALADSGHDLDPPPQGLKVGRSDTANRRIYEKSVAKLNALAAAQAEPEPEAESTPATSPPLPPGEGLPQSPQGSFGNPAADHLAARALDVPTNPLADLEHYLTLDNAYSL